MSKLRPPGSAVDLGKLNTEEIEMIELLVLGIWLSQILHVKCVDFVFICVLTSLL